MLKKWVKKLEQGNNIIEVYFPPSWQEVSHHVLGVSGINAKVLSRAMWVGVFKEHHVRYNMASQCNDYKSMRIFSKQWFVLLEHCSAKTYLSML